MKWPAALAGYFMTRCPTLTHGLGMVCQAIVINALLIGLAQSDTDPAEIRAPASVSAFELVIKADDSHVRTWLEKHLLLQRYTTLADLDDIELSRLLRDADVQARELMATLGFFDPQLRWTQNPSSQADVQRRVQLEVSPGPLARIAQVNWHWQGDVAQNAPALQQTIMRQWPLRPGQPFTQADWSQAKTLALRQLVSERYPWGRILESQAQVDAQSHQVVLDLTLDSGPLVKLGPLQITGADHYGTAQVERLARLPIGVPYRQSELLEAQQRLVVSGFYDSVFVSLDPEGTPDASPVKVELKETLRQKWVLGLGVRSDSGARITAEHTHHSLPGLGWRSVSKLAIDKNLQTLGLDLLAPPDDSLWRWNTSTRVQQEKLTGFQLNSQRWRVGRTQSGERIDRAYYAQYDWAQQIGNLQGRQEAISGNYAWTWRHFDSLPFPSRGLGWGFELGAGVTLGTPNEPYVRWLTKGLWLQPIGETSGRLALRAELGSVVSKDTSSLPATQLFLAGGDHSVRGYAPNSIGIAQPNGSILAGRYLATSSIEWQRPLTVNQQRSEWESALFVDAGSVANDLHTSKIRVAYGVGARWRSPVGPLRMDLAYGQSTRKLRLHLNVGFIF